MNILYIGLFLFIAMHLVPCVAVLRGSLVDRLGEKRYRAIFSAVSIASLAMVVWGYSQAEFNPIYHPPAWGRPLAIVAVPVAMILFAAAKMPTHIRAFLQHPMIVGLLLWAFAHLVANGDQASVAMFGAFALYAVIALVSSFARGKTPSTETPRLTMDLAAIAGGLALSALLVKFHGALFGMPLFAV